MTVDELALRGIAPHRMILAACDVAADVSHEADEQLGFVGALMTHGRSGLVASAVGFPT